MMTLAQLYIDAGLTPPQRFLDNSDTIVTNQDVINTKNHIASLTGTAPTGGTTPTETTAPTDSTSPTWTPDSRLLGKGARGEDVKTLQRMLLSLGYDLGTFGPNGDGVDGIFGSVTLAAVRAFQSDSGIAVDGIAGPITFGELDKAIAALSPTSTPPPADTGGGDTGGGGTGGGGSTDPRFQRTGVLDGGETILVTTSDGLERYYQIYEFPPGSGNYMAFQFNDLDHLTAVLGRDYSISNRSETWFDQNILVEASAEEITGKGNFQRYVNELMTDAASAAGIRDPSLIGLIASNPEMQQIMAQAIAGDWTPAQVLAEQRRTDFWKNVLYPGIEAFYGRTGDPEKAWNNYAENVSPALRALGYEADANGTFNVQIKEMLDKGIDMQTFLSQVPTFIRAEQNAEFAEVLNRWAERDLGRNIAFNDWFDLLTGEALPEIEQVAENARLAYLSGQTGTGLEDTQIAELAGRTDLSDAEAFKVFSDFTRGILAVGEAGLRRGDLTKDEVLAAFAGVAPDSGRSIEQVKLNVAKLARENDLFDEEKIQFYVGFTPLGTPTRPGLLSLSPEGA
jgi:peptidoglycan hydrolase-like protein with peptidoglycan-binding domain